MLTAAGKLAVWEIVDSAFHFTRQNYREVAIAAAPAIVATEVLDYVVSGVERSLGLADPAIPVPWASWLPLHFVYLLIVTFLLALASVPIVEIALNSKRYTRPYLQPDGRVLRLWLTLFVVWLVTFLVTAGFQLGADWLVTWAMVADFDVTLAVISHPWYAPSFWLLHLLIMVAVLARLSFFAPAVAVVEGGTVFRRSWGLCRGRFLRVLLIGLAVEVPFVIGFVLLPLPFYGTLGFGAESVFQDGVLVTAPEISAIVTLVKHALDGAFGLAETATFTAATVAAYRQLRPELEFE